MGEPEVERDRLGRFLLSRSREWLETDRWRETDGLIVDGTRVDEAVVVGEDCVGSYFTSGTRSASGHVKWRMTVFVAHYRHV